MNEEISVEAANGAIDNLVNDIHKLQEPKTPTKEQIEYLKTKIPDCASVETKLFFAITEWEKIRNS